MRTSDFDESDRSQPLMDGIEAVHRSGVPFIPAGSVTGSGSQSGKLVTELKIFLT